MYNRYLRNDEGVYTCLPQEDAPRSHPPPEQTAPERAQVPPQEEARESTSHDPPRGGEEREGFALLGRILDRLHLQDLDSADLMLLALLFFLFEEKADDELLIALGLLLIL